MKLLLPIGCLCALLGGVAGVNAAGLGTAPLFGRPNQCVDVSIPALASNYTISAWVYLFHGGDFYSTRLGVLTGTNCGDSVEMLIRSNTGSSNDTQFLELGRCGLFNGAASTNGVPLQQWVNVVISVDSNKMTRYYINGEPSGVTDNASVDVTLGPRLHLADNMMRCFDGMLDEVQIWSRALSEGEIQANMQRAPGVGETNLVAYWPFNGNAGSALTVEASGFNRHGLLVHTPGRGTPSPVWSHQLRLNGNNPMTNEWHTVFTDPGVTVWAGVSAIAAGGWHSLALKADGSVVGWGRNDFGQCNTPAAATDVVVVAAGEYHSLAIKAGGSVLAWGKTDEGQCTVPSTATSAVAVAAGGYHSLALRADGTIITWGNNTYGQCTVPSAATNIVAISAGWNYSLAVRADGTVLAWGQNNANQCSVPGWLTNAVGIAAGGEHGLAFRAAGSATAWGANDYDQCTGIPSMTNAVAMAGGGFHSLALKADGSVVGWGNNSSGQRTIPAAATNVIAIAAGHWHSVALKADGTVIAWGSGGMGQCNVPSSVNILYPAITTNSTVNMDVPGTYEVTYSVSYLSLESVVRTVVVIDPTPLPVITLLGDNPYVVLRGTTYQEPGATAVDAYATNLTADIVITGAVDTGVCADYIRTYTVADSGGRRSTTNRSVYVWDRPDITALSAFLIATNAATGTRDAELTAAVNPNGPETVVYFQYGLDTSYAGNGDDILLSAGYANSNLVQLLDRLCLGVMYHWRIVASNSIGTTATADRIFEISTPYARGDFNGNGIVEQDELSDVYVSYWQDNPTYITNTLGLGTPEVLLAVDNMIGWDLSVQYSDDLLTWSNLQARAVPVFRFTDPDATNRQSRMYRLAAP